MPAPPDNADDTPGYSGIDRDLRPASFLEYLTDPDADPAGGGAIDGTANLAGTVCERALVALYEGRIGRSLSVEAIRKALDAAGHAKSTIGRAVTNLVKHGVLVTRPDGLVYTGASLPIPKKYFSKAGDKHATNRFGGSGGGGERVARELEQEAKLVQAVLIDQLDRIFAEPMSRLATISELVARADRLARAVEGGLHRDADRQAAQVRILADKLNGDAERRQRQEEPKNQPIGPREVMDAVAVALFPSEFEELPDIAAEIAEHHRRRQEAAAEMNLHVAAENTRVLAANVEIDRENVERKALGLKLLPREEVIIPQTEPKWVDGLVVPDRLGEARMSAFVQWYTAGQTAAGDA